MPALLAPLLPQPLVFHSDSVMIAVARGGRGEQLPMLLEFPRRALGTNTAFSMLGFGWVRAGPGIHSACASTVGHGICRA